MISKIDSIMRHKRGLRTVCLARLCQLLERVESAKIPKRVSALVRALSKCVCTIRFASWPSHQKYTAASDRDVPNAVVSRREKVIIFIAFRRAHHSSLTSYSSILYSAFLFIYPLFHNFFSACSFHVAFIQGRKLDAPLSAYPMIN